MRGNFKIKASYRDCIGVNVLLGQFLLKVAIALAMRYVLSMFAASLTCLNDSAQSGSRLSPPLVYDAYKRDWVTISMPMFSGEYLYFF